MSHGVMSAPRSRRINLRASERQEVLLKEAARAKDATLTEFVLGSAIEEAERVLANRRWFTASEEQHEALLALLDEPVDDVRLRAMLARPTPFGRAFALDEE